MPSWGISLQWNFVLSLLIFWKMLLKDVVGGIAYSDMLCGTTDADACGPRRAAGRKQTGA